MRHKSLSFKNIQVFLSMFAALLQNFLEAKTLLFRCKSSFSWIWKRLAGSHLCPVINKDQRIHPPLCFSLLRARRTRPWSWHGTVRLPCVQANYVPPELQGLSVTPWNQRPGRVQGGGDGFSIHGHIKQDSLSVGCLWRRARHSHTPLSQFTHSLSTFLPLLVGFRSLSAHERQRDSRMM